jgi:hypothetical protein
MFVEPDIAHWADRAKKKLLPLIALTGFVARD